MKEDEVFEGVIIDGKKFPFKRLTVSSSAKMLKKLLPSFFQSLRNVFFKYNEEKHWWKKIRGLAFERQGLWRIGIVPYELRCNVITPKKAREAEESFFGYAPEIVQECEKLSKYPNHLSTQNSNKNETL